MGVCTSSVSGGATATAWRGVSLAARGGVGGLSPTSPAQAVLPLAPSSGYRSLHFATAAQDQVPPGDFCACGHETPKKLPLPLLPVPSRSMRPQAPQQGPAESIEIDGQAPPILRSTSAPMLPSRAVPSRMELFRQQEEARQNGDDAIERNEGHSPLLPAPKSPTTACSAARRRKRRSVTFGEAELVRFTVEASEPRE